MEIEEMPIEEKYERLCESAAIMSVTMSAFLKENGLTDKYVDYSVKVAKKMLPTLMGPAFKLMKMLAPGKAFKQFVKSFLPMIQYDEPISNIEVVRLSDREAVVRIKNSALFKQLRDAVKKTGLELDLREMVERGIRVPKEVAKDFGIDLTYKLEEDGYTTVAKLQK